MRYIGILILLISCNYVKKPLYIGGNPVKLGILISDAKVDSAFEMVLEFELILRNTGNHNIKIKALDGYDLVFAFTDSVLYPNELQIVFYDKMKKSLKNISYYSFGSLKYAKNGDRDISTLVSPNQKISEVFKFGLSNVLYRGSSANLNKSDYYCRIFFPYSAIVGTHLFRKEKFIVSDYIKFTIQ